MDIILVGMYDDKFWASVSIIGKAVKEPPPYSFSNE